MKSVKLNLNYPAVVVFFSIFIGFRQWDEDIVHLAADSLAQDLPLAPGAPGGMVEFRRTLVTSFFFKFFLSVHHKLQTQVDMSNELDL